MSTRAFGANVERLVRRTTIVYSADDIRRAITVCIEEKRPCNLELGDNVVVEDRGFTIPADLVSFSLDGGDQYKLVVRGTLDSLFTFRTPSMLVDTSVLLASGATIPVAFVLGADDVALQGVRFDAVTRGRVDAVFGMDVGRTITDRLTVERCRFNEVRYAFADNGAALWRFCKFEDCIFTVDPDFGSPTVIGWGSAGIKFLNSTFSRIPSAVTVSLGAGSDGCVFSSIPVFFSLDTASVGTLGHTFISCGAITKTLGGLDVWVPDLAGATKLPTVLGGLTLNTAAPTITPGASSYLRVTHGALASGNVTVAPGVDGQLLVLRFVTVAGTAVYTDGAGNLQLASTFTPTALDTLSLIYDDAAGLWFETSRSLN